MRQADPGLNLSTKRKREFLDKMEGTGCSDLRRVFRRTRHTIDVEALLRIMVLNRLCVIRNPSWASCAGCKRWPCPTSR